MPMAGLIRASNDGDPNDVALIPFRSAGNNLRTCSTGALAVMGAVSPAPNTTGHIRKSTHVTSMTVAILDQRGADTKKQEKFSNFGSTGSAYMDYGDILISQWQSSVTGLQVVHIDYEAPNDDGCAHALVYLAFCGSGDHPYPGFLYGISPCHFTSTTNATTCEGCAVITISTAKEYTFLKMLPVSVDHILYPRLARPDFLTEVFHINQEGHDARVVHSEVQGMECTSLCLTNLVSKRSLYLPHLPPLLPPEISTTLVVCGSGQNEEAVSGFFREGFETDANAMNDEMSWDIERKAIAAMTLGKSRRFSL